MSPVLLFDFDGTIADTFDLAMSIGKRISESFRLQIATNEEIIRFRNMPFRDAVRALQIPFRRMPALMLRIRREIHENIDEIRPFDGMRDVLQELRGRCDLLGMVTSNSEENVARFLQRHELDFFDFGAYSSAIFGKASKLRTLIHKHRLQKESILYIGDTVGDIESCRKVGVSMAAVTWGYNSREILASGKPDFLVSGPLELLDIVKI
jgi:HAD superfamily hydrolase (TIGR01549 family)